MILIITDIVCALDNTCVAQLVLGMYRNSKGQCFRLTPCGFALIKKELNTILIGRQLDIRRVYSYVVT